MFFATPHMLIFVLLLLIHYGVDGVQSIGLSRRADPDHDITDPANANPDHDTTNIPGFTNTPPNTAYTGSPLPTASTSLSSGASSSSASSLATSASNSGAGSGKIGTIVGAILGFVILAGIGLMILAYFRRRARKAARQPQGSSYFNEQTTAMSQTLNGPPLNSSTPLVQSPSPLHGSSISTNNTSPLTPFMRGATSINATSSLYRPLSTSEIQFDHSDLHPHTSLSSSFDNHQLERPLSVGPSIPGQSSAYDLSPDTPLLRRALSAGPSSSQVSPLHREMAGFQKTLEVNHKRDISGQSQQSTNIISDPISDPINDSTINELNDPPPKYNI